MALIAIASDKGAPGVTTAALALAAVWPRPVLLAECDPAGGDLVYRFPAVGGGHLDPRRGVLSLAVVARRGMQPQQVWEHVQKLHGGLDVLAGVTNAEQGAGLSLLWGPIGKALASMPQADVIADCGRLGADGPLYDLLAEATTVVLVTKVHVADVIRLRDRAIAFAAAAQSRGRRNFGVGVVVVADHKKFRASLGEVQHVLGQANAPATVLGGIAHDTKGADLLSGEWGGNLDRTMLIKTAREVARQLVQGLPPIGNPAEPGPAVPAHAQAQPGTRSLRHAQRAPRGAGPPPARGHRPRARSPATGPRPGRSSGSPQPGVAPLRRGRPTRGARHDACAAAWPRPSSPRPTSPTSAAPRSASPAGPGRGQAHPAGPQRQAPTGAPRAGTQCQPGLQRAGPGRPHGGMPRRQAQPAAPAGGTRHPGRRQVQPRWPGTPRRPQAGTARNPGTAWTAPPSGIREPPGSFFSRPPMTPLTASDGQAPAELPEQENPEDTGWGAPPGTARARPGLGSRRSGGG